MIPVIVIVIVVRLTVVAVVVSSSLTRYNTNGITWGIVE